jgi:hypothetical protein
MAEPLNTLVKAFVTRWIDAGTLTGIAGPFQGDEAPTDKASVMPRCTFVASGDLKLQTTDNEYYDIDITIRVIDTSPENIGSAMGLIRAAYDSDANVGTMTLDEGELITIEPKGPVRYLQLSKREWRGELNYKFQTTKPRTA